LGTRQLRGALDALAVALDDANTNVREEGMRAIIELLRRVTEASVVGLARSAQALLHKIIASPEATDSERIIARAVLLQLGERTEEAALKALMSNAATDEKLRLLIIELVDGRSDLVRAALADRSIRVRFFAARRRFEQHGRDAIPILLAMLQNPGEEALLSYWMLRGLGERPPAPAHLADLLGRSSVGVRQDVVRIIADVNLRDALPILEQALRDPASAVRREVATTAFKLYQATPDQRLIDLLSALTSDLEADVRAQALTALRRLIRLHAPATARSEEAAASKVAAVAESPDLATSAKNAAPPAVDLGRA
jgi:hypothetical protein